MNFLHHDLGHLPQGAVVEVVLDKQANVLLLDDSNIRAYQRDERWNGFGGWCVRSPLESPCRTRDAGTSPSTSVAEAAKFAHP